MRADEDWGRFFTLSVEMMCVLDGEGRFRRVNPAWTRTLGHAEGTLLGRPYLELVHPDDHEAAAALTFEVRVRAADGGWRWLAWSVTPHEAEAVRYAVVLDVTARRAADERRDTLAGVTQALIESRTVDDAAPRVLQAVGEHMGWELGALWLVDPTTDTMRCRAVWQAPGVAGEFVELTRRTTFPRGIGMPGRVWATGAPLWISDISSDDNFPRATAAARAGLHGACAFPLPRGGAVSGVLEFFTRALRPVAEEQRSLLADVARLVGQLSERMGRVEAQLAGTEDRLRSVIDLAPIVLFAVDAAGRIVLSEGHGLAALGFKPGQLDGQSAFDIYPDHPEIPGLLRRALAGETFSALIAVDALVFETHFRGLHDATGAVTGALGVGTDVSSWKHAEDALRRSEGRFRRLIESIPDAIGLYRDGRFVYANPAAVRFFGYPSATALVGVELQSIIHPDDAAAARDYLRSLGHGTAVPVRELRFVRRDGEVVIAECAGIAVDFEGAPATLTIARDVTERRQLEVRLLHADRMASLGTLAAGVAHEINNPLTYVLMNLDSVGRDLRRLPEDPSAMAVLQERLGDAREGIARIATIVQDLGTFSRQQEDARGPVDVRRVLESTINMAWSQIQPRARLVRQFSEVPAVQGNASRLAQVFLNLLMNAAQAIPEGDPTHHEIRLGVRAGAIGRVLVEVTDTGGGIAPRDLGRIYDPFFTTKPAGIGTGLGLSICHGIVTALGGEIEVASELGAGTTFRVSLPAVQAG